MARDGEEDEVMNYTLYVVKMNENGRCVLTSLATFENGEHATAYAKNHAARFKCNVLLAAPGGKVTVHAPFA